MNETTPSITSAPANFSTPVPNQCDGCLQRAPINGHGNHVDAHGKPFMSCTRGRYLGAPTSEASAAGPAQQQDTVLGLLADLALAHDLYSGGEKCLVSRARKLIPSVKQAATLAAPPAPAVEMSDEALDELHERLERKVAAAIKADPATTGGVRVERGMYLRELLAEASKGIN